LSLKYIRSLLNYFRKIGFGLWVDNLIYTYHYLKNYHSNRDFKKLHPQVKIPPSYMVFESFKMNYNSYYYGGMETAKWIVSLLSEFIDLRQPVKILDWGCGPSRVLRHIPALLHSGSFVAGSDYNENTISWNRKNIGGISYSVNKLSPPLPFTANMFDAVYSISVFTHLDQHLFRPWLEELNRILKPGGILIITLHGDAFQSRLEANEQDKFNKGEVVVHKSNMEGHRSYGAFHPSSFVEKNMAGIFFIEKILWGTIVNGIPQQDTWILRKQIQ
jgi:SAM-dependent methyltransferase